MSALADRNSLTIPAPADCLMEAQDESIELVRRMANGDAAAVSELYSVHGQRMYAFALRLTGDPSLAEDVTQESLVAAWRAACRFRGNSRVRTWLLGIVHNLASKTMRRASQPLTPQMTATLSASLPTPEASLQASQLAACIRRQMDSMSYKHRAALELVFYHGLSLEEAAQVCQCPVGTIKSRLSHAKATLKEALQRAGIAAKDIR